MRIAVLSDIHSNLEALEAVLEHARIEGADGFYILGDIVGYGADPNEVIAHLVSLSERTLLAGNHDLAAVGRFDTGWFNDVAAAAIKWTADMITPDSIRVLEGLSPREHTDIALLVHGSVVDPVAEYVQRAEQAAASFAAEDFEVCFFGHTHKPTMFVQLGERVRGSVLHDGEQVPLGGRSMLNPGSVGQPRDRDPRASFGIFDLAARTFTIHRSPYDVATAQRKIRDAGLPEPLAERLAVGR